MEDILLEEQAPIEPALSSPFIRFPAHIISVIFHPLFIPLYVTGFLLFLHPTMFNGLEPVDKLRILATVFVNYTLLPAATVFLLWRLKFAKSISLSSQKERIIPYAATMVFAFWCWNVFRHFNYSPAFTQFLLGSFIAVIIGWMANIYFKISMHALGVGGLLYFITSISLSGEAGSGLYIIVALMITGITCTSRLLVGQHRPFEIYAGLVAGIASQWIAAIL